MKECLIDGCDRDASSKAHGRNGYCSAHYQRIRIHGDAMTYKKVAKPFEFKNALLTTAKEALTVSMVESEDIALCTIYELSDLATLHS